MSRGPRVLTGMRGRLGAYAPALCERARATLERMARRSGLGPRHELSLLVTDSAAIRALNRRWRAMDHPTDVLSFPQHTLKEGAPAPAGPLGDIVICLPALRRDALQAGHGVEYHLGWLLAHGLLHLLGYDHAHDRQERRMRRAEAALLTQEFPTHA